MTKRLEPMLKYTEDCLFRGNRYNIQLEIPKGSTLTDADISKIFKVTSWEESEMENMADGFEGGRSVLVKKDKKNYDNNIPLEALQISGVGYFELERVGGKRAFFTPKGKMKPPSKENFYDHMDLMVGEGSTATGMINGIMQHEGPAYAPRGSYLESRAKKKINKTREARRLGLRSMTVPRIEAYGRYLDLIHEDEHLSFIVFPVPSLSGRFAESFVKNFDGSFDYFVGYMGALGERLGKATRELHDKGKCHRQLHLSNLYYIPELEGLYVMDWVTMMDIKGIDADKRTIDIRIPHQNVERMQELMFGDMKNSPEGDFLLGASSVFFLEQMLNSYFKKKIDVMELSGKIQNRKGIVDDVATIAEIMRMELLNPEGRKIGRNEPCPCGSGIKYKKCCGY